ncbi:MAG: TraB/GumN family protein [Flavitalea sp.]
MFVRKIALIVVSLSTAAIAFGQVKKPSVKKTGAPVKQKIVNPAPKPAAIKKHNPDHTLLWQISGNGLTQPSYIFGTMHILCADDAKLSGPLKKVIKESKQIFFEVDMDDMQQMMGALQYARMNDGTKLSDLLTPVEHDRVKAYFDSHKSILPFSMMARFKPYFINALIAEGMMDCKAKAGMEESIMKESKLYDKEIKGFETMEFQASLFDSIPYEKQAKDLLMYVDSIDLYKKNTMDMVDLYRKQDLQLLDSMVLKSDPGMEQYMDLLLYSRNKRWASEMPEQMFQAPTLFAVGAGHLPGVNGVLKLLRDQGFTVKPSNNRD